ncbi:MAG: N-6 DNA methylase, partial [Muribaculum sp.]|nr:N-6 DNA methylase [Muribaculum sp.]
IINCGEYDWKDINPDIFGSMIQAVITPAQRAGLGMHYTSVPNIEKVIRPLFLDSLIEEYTAACDEAKEKMSKKQNPARATQRLRNLLNRLSHIKFFDPACGSGNFLIITYKRLRELEIMIWQAMRDIANDAMLPFPSITLTQFYGIELDPFAADTATLSLWLAEHQMNVKFGQAFGVLPDTLPLKASGQIVCGNACRLNWNTVCPHTPDEEVYIMGNPPYLGSAWQDTTQKEDMSYVFKGQNNYKNLDYIACWFWKGAKYIENSLSSCAFVSTNSICQGEQVSMLWQPLLSKDIKISFAVQSFRWNNNAKYNATVTCVIVGLSSKMPFKARIYSGNTKRIVDHINGYLLPTEDIAIGRLSEPISDLPPICKGSMARDDGFLLLDEQQAKKLIESYPQLELVIKSFIGAAEFLRDIPRYCLWFNSELYQQFKDIPEIKERMAAVADVRAKSKAPSTQAYSDRPYLFVQRTYQDKPFVYIPQVTSERRTYVPIGLFKAGTVTSDKAFSVYDGGLLTFAIVSSYMHILWFKTFGGRLETRYSYSSNMCYNSFPFPKLTIAEKEALSELAQTILDIRDENCDMTLGEMYNPETMPEELREAHHRLDLAVERIYRAEPFTSDEERLEHLFRLYAKMTKK